MKAKMGGTVIGGQLQLDRLLDLPDHSRVDVVVESVCTDATEWEAAMKKFKELRKRYPIRSGGCRFTREELHERR